VDKVKNGSFKFWLAAKRRRLGTRFRLVAGTELRNSEAGLLLLAAIVGVVVGPGVTLMREAVGVIHYLLLGVPLSTHLSNFQPPAWRMLVGLPLGGLVVGVAVLLVRRWRPREAVDAIEANALHGGRMSLTDSLNIALVTVLSAGAGASVGLEAGYTQLGSGVASRFGQWLRLRRGDLRMLVGCGAAAAIATAFNAPLAGAFYAFELILGSYTLATLLPVSIAALVGTLVGRATLGVAPIFVLHQPFPLSGREFALAVLLGAISAGLGILVMWGITTVETWLRRVALPRWLRQAAGGVVLALLALAFPQVLGAGHGAILIDLGAGFPLPLLLGLIVAKIAASAISIGSGFRGGLFSTSLLIGSLVGTAFALVAQRLLPGLEGSETAFALIGMGALAAAVVGAPVTMILLVLEATGDFSVTLGVTVGVVAASFILRQTFNYSFSTWRFHLRGVPIRSPHDIGWIGDLTVGRLMRRDARTVPAGLPLAELRVRFPAGQVKYLFVLDDRARYVGAVDLAEAHAAELDDRLASLAAGDLAKGAMHVAAPGDNIRVALSRFVAGRTEVLAVISPNDERLVGYLSEAYALRRYTDALEKLRADEHGDSGLFGKAD
jgi:CIC family chloride channel protein